MRPDRAHTQTPSKRALLTGLLSGPVVWLAYFLTVYGLVEAVCMTGRLEAPLLGHTTVLILIAGLTGAALLGMLWSGRAAHQAWKQAGDQPAQAGDEDVEERTRFLSRSGVLLNGLFVIVTLMTLLPALSLRLCK